MSRPPYEILEHTADVGLKVYGQTLPELYANAGRGLVSLALEPQDFRSTESVPLRAEGEDPEELFVNWLSEILYHMDAEGWAFSEFRIRQLLEGVIEAQGWGERRRPEELPRRVAVKAVTYHQLAMLRTPEGWEAVVYFDI